MGAALKPCERLLIRTFYKETNRSARETERRLKQEPYFSSDLDFSYKTIIRCWKEYGLEIRPSGEASTKGKTWKCRKH